MSVFSAKKRHRGGGARPWALLGLALTSASCVPAAASDAPLAISAVPSIIPSAEAAVARPAAPAVAALTAGADSFVFRGRTPLDRMRSLDCLAQAIYYEAASESEDGQRAVAQVVLNRVRHPAWPNSVCGVVYQGPMRPGGGCQFTFTCDGSLMRSPGGPAWARARTLAAEALAGRTYAPVGLSTHYHTHAVAPSWAPRLSKTLIIGAHIFYGLPGAWGAAPAFNARYAGAEPLPRPSMTLVRRAAVPLALEALLAPPASAAELRAAVALPSDIPQDPRWTPSNLPESTVREEYRHSGQWREDAPAAITGR
ncbi:MAG TPA: cell wall hydrolase [Allosphingosinicella sp.]|nr:cell wall hydrolase [Allosphingosinicella sp.]